MATPLVATKWQLIFESSESDWDPKISVPISNSVVIFLFCPKNSSTGPVLEPQDKNFPPFSSLSPQQQQSCLFEET